MMSTPRLVRLSKTGSLLTVTLWRSQIETPFSVCLKTSAAYDERYATVITPIATTIQHLQLLAIRESGRYFTITGLPPP